MRRNKGFTLIEMLAIVVILGVLMGIGIMTYSSYVGKTKNKAYDLAEESMRNSAMSAIADCLTGGSRDFCAAHTIPEDQYTYEVIKLKELIDDEYIDEIKDPYNTDKICDSSLSYVYLSNKKDYAAENNLDLTYKVCLICSKYKSKDCLGDEEGGDIDNPTTYETFCKVSYDESGNEVYDGKWTNRDLYLHFSVKGDYKYGIDYFKYRQASGSWTKLKATNNSGLVTLNNDVANKVITVNAYDGLNQESTASCGTIKIDKAEFKSVSLTGKSIDGDPVTSGNWALNNVVLTAVTNPGNTVSGYLYTWYKDGTVIEGATASTYTATLRGNYKVEVKTGVGNKTIMSNEFVVKIDKNNPVCSLNVTGTIGSNSYYTNNVGISISNVSDLEGDGLPGSGIASQSLSHSSITSNTGGTVVTGTVVDKVGRVGTCKTTIKRDATPPSIKSVTATKSSAGTVVASGAWSNQNLKITLTANTSTSGTTIYYCNDTANTCTPTTRYSAAFQVSTAGTSFVRYKVVSGSGLSSGVGVYIARVDTGTPAISFKASPLTLSSGANYNFLNNINYSYTVSSGTVYCSPANNSTVGSGNVTITCTATGNNGNSRSVSFVVTHSYAASFACQSGWTLVGTNCQGTCSGQNCYECTNPHNCRPGASYRNETLCDYSCSDGGTRTNCKRYTCPEYGWCGIGDGWSTCDDYNYTCNNNNYRYYICPNGGTLSGSICNF